MPDVLVFAALVPKIFGARVILDLHDPMPELMLTIFKLPPESFSVRMLKWLEKWSTGFANVVLTVNLASKRIYSSRSCAPEKIRVVMNSPNEDIFQFRPAPAALPNGKVRRQFYDYVSWITAAPEWIRPRSEGAGDRKKIHTGRIASGLRRTHAVF